MGRTSTKAKNKYNKTAYRRITVHLKPEVMEVFNKHCEAFSYTKNNFIIQAIKDRIEKETGKKFDDLMSEIRTADEVGSAETAEGPGTGNGER